MTLTTTDKKQLTGRQEIIKRLIATGQVKHYKNMTPAYKKEVRKDELPALYRTKAGYLYVVTEGEND